MIRYEYFRVPKLHCVYTRLELPGESVNHSWCSLLDNGADCFVLQGSALVGDATLGAFDYLQVPANAAVAMDALEADTQILLAFDGKDLWDHIPNKGQFFRARYVGRHSVPLDCDEVISTISLQDLLGSARGAPQTSPMAEAAVEKRRV